MPCQGPGLVAARFAAIARTASSAGSAACLQERAGRRLGRERPAALPMAAQPRHREHAAGARRVRVGFQAWIWLGLFPQERSGVPRRPWHKGRMLRFFSSVLNSVRYYGLCGSVVGPEALQGGGQQDECLFAGKVVAREVGGLLAVHDSWARGGSADEAAFHLPAQQGPCVCCSALRWQSALLVERGEIRGARWHVLYGACVLFAAEPGCQARDNPRPCPLHSEMGPMRRRGVFVLARARILTACLLTHAPRTHLPA